MSNKRREAEKNFGLFLNPGGAASEGGYLVPMDSLNVGPGAPGPGDEWHLPMEPAEIEDQTTVLAVDSAGPPASPIHPSDKG